jgi:hypothetical protein
MELELIDAVVPEDNITFAVSDENDYGDGRHLVITSYSSKAGTFTTMLLTADASATLKDWLGQHVRRAAAELVP